jgi:hypothetical protein
VRRRAGTTFARVRFPPPDLERDRLEVELIRLWARLEPWVKIGGFWRAQRDSRLGAWPMDVAWAVQVPRSTLDDGVADRGGDVPSDYLSAEYPTADIL